MPLLSQNVMVLAKNFALSDTQKSLLNRGLTFVPTMDFNWNQRTKFELDMQNYHRRLKLAAYFKNSTKQQKASFPMAKSHWTPSAEKLPPEINFLVKKDQKDFNKHFKNYTEKPNLLPEEQDELKQLMKNKHIVIKPADKGSVVVILDRDQYIREVDRQLNDKIYYTKLKEPIYLKTVPEVHGIIDDLYNKKHINNRQTIFEGRL